MSINNQWESRSKFVLKFIILQLFYSIDKIIDFHASHYDLRAYFSLLKNLRPRKWLVQCITFSLHPNNKSNFQGFVTKWTWSNCSGITKLSKILSKFTKSSLFWKVTLELLRQKITTIARLNEIRHAMTLQIKQLFGSEVF